MSRLPKRLRGVSSLIAVVLIILITIIGGLILFYVTQSLFFAEGPASAFSIDNAWLVRDTLGRTSFAVTIKNIGRKPIVQLNITLNHEDTTTYNLSSDPLEPGESASFSPPLAEVYIVGNSYSLTVSGRFSDGSIYSISQTLKCSGSGGYTEKRFITFHVRGVDDTATEPILIVDGQEYSYSDFPLSFHWLKGTLHTFEWKETVASTDPEKRFIWQSTEGLSNKRTGTILVKVEGDITATYSLEVTRRVVFDAEGIHDATEPILTVDGVDYTADSLPKVFYWKNGTEHTFAWCSPILDGDNTRFIWQATEGLANTQTGSLLVTQSGYINATYSTQYYLTVVITPETGGEVTLDPANDWFDAGSSVVATATPNPDYAFEGWILNGEPRSENPVTFTIDEPTTLEALFIKTTTIIFNATGLASDSIGIVLTVDGVSYSVSELPLTFNWIVGSSHTYTWEEIVSAGAGKRYAWSSCAGLSTSRSEVITVPDNGGYIQANYYTEYLLSISTTTGGTTDPSPGDYWQREGDIITITALPDPNYKLDYWEINGIADGSATTIQITMNTTYSITAHFKLSVAEITFNVNGLNDDATGDILTVDGVNYEYSDLPRTFTWEIGSTHTFAWASPVPATAGKQYAWESTTGLSTKQSDTIAVPQGGGEITAIYKIQYQLTLSVTLGSGTTDPAPGTYWYDSGTEVEIMATPAESYIFAYWMINGVQNTSNPVTVIMNQPITVEAYFQEVAIVRFNVEGLTSEVDGSLILQIDDVEYRSLSDFPIEQTWLVGSTHSFVWNSPISIGAEKRFIWQSTQGISTEQSGFILVPSGGGDINATYQAEYKVTFEASGLDSSAMGEIVTVDDTSYTFADLPVSFWWAEGSIHSYAYAEIVQSSTDGKRFKLAEVNGPASPITISDAEIITGNYQIEYCLSISATTGGTTDPAPGDYWYSENTIVTITALPDSTYEVDYWEINGVPDGSDISIQVTMDQPYTIVAHFKLSVAEVTFNVEGLSDDASGTVLTVDGVSYVYSDLPASFTWVVGSSHDFAWASPISAGTGKQYVWQSTTGLSTGQSGTIITTKAGGNVNASYITQFELSISVASGSGTTDPAPGTYWYDSGSSVEITAIPSESHIFAYWLINGVKDTSNPTSVEITQPVTVEAYFQEVAVVRFNVAGLTSEVDGKVILTVDGVDYTSVSDFPVEYTWLVGSSHTFSWSSSLTVGSDKRFTWQSTSGLSTEQSGIITVPSGGGWINATYQAEYLVSISAGTGGTTDPAPGNYWYAEGTQLTVTAIPDADYGFDYWEINGVQDGTDSVLVLTVDQSYSLIANFKLLTFEVSFEAIGLSDDASGTVLTVDGNDYVYSDLPVTFVWEVGSSHNFAWASPVSAGSGKRYVWESTTGLSTEQSGTIIVPNGGGEVVASYRTQYQLTISVASGSGTTTPAPGSYWYDSDVSVEIMATPATSYIFAYWLVNGVQNTSNPVTVIMDQAKVVEAYFQEVATVQFDVNGLTSEVDGQVILTVDGVDYTQLSDFPVEYTWLVGSPHTFAWHSPLTAGSNKRFVWILTEGLSSDRSGAVTVPSGGGQITATYETEYLVSISAEAGGTTDPAPGDYWYPEGTQLTITAIPDQDYELDYWEINGAPDGNQESLSLTVDQPYTIVAHFKLSVAQVSFNAVGLGSDTTGAVLTVDGVTYNYADLPVTFTWVIGSSHDFAWSSPVSASAGKQYVWESTSGLSTEQSGTITVPSGGGEITATYETQYQLTISVASGSGTTDPAPGTYWYDSGAEVEITASPATSYIFAYWMINGVQNTSNPVTVIMDQPITVEAYFQEVATVKFNVEGLTTEVNNLAILTVDGVDYTQLSDFPVEYTWLVGSTHTFSWHSPLSVSSDKQFVWASTEGLSSEQMETITVPSGGGWINATYHTEYKITFEVNGLDTSAIGTVVTIDDTVYAFNALPISFWWVEGSTHSYTYESIVQSVIDGKQFRLDSVSGSASPITVSGAEVICGNYVTQWQVTFSASGLDDSASSPVLNVNLPDYSGDIYYGELPYSTWVDDGTWIYYSYYDPVSSLTSGKRFKGIDVPTEVMANVNAPLSVTGNYLVQWLVTFDASGLDDSASGVVVTVDGVSLTYDDLPYSEWVNDGATVTYSYSSPVESTVEGKRFTLTSVDGPTSPITVSEAVTVTGNYQVEYSLSISTTTGGTTDPAPGDYWYAEGTAVSVQAIPSDGYAFDYWLVDGAESTENPISVTMDGPHTLEAYFMTAVFYKWEDGTQSDSITLTYNIYQNLWLHDANASYGLMSTGVHSCTVQMYIESINDTTPIANFTMIIRAPDLTEVARIVWTPGDSIPTTPQTFQLEPNTKYTIEIWILGSDNVSDVSISVKLEVP